MNTNLNNLDKELQLACGAILKNRLVKSPMSDSLGDGKGNPTEAQIRLYERWAEDEVALSIIGEVQIDYHCPEKPGNLVLIEGVDKTKLREFTSRAKVNGAHIWPQLGHAGALSYAPVSSPKGPSPLDIDGLKCEGMTKNEIIELVNKYASAAKIAKEVGFTGIMIHAGHGFLLSQFLSPLFNHREDEYGGSIESRSKVVIDIVNAIRKSVGKTFPVAIRINSSDMLEGGLSEEDALKVVALLDKTSIDLIDISGGTYFPGAKSCSDASTEGAYFVEFAKKAKLVTDIPLILSGGFKKCIQAQQILSENKADMIGVGRAMILEPKLASIWLSDNSYDPVFPRFEETVPGGLTAWYSMKQIAIGEDKEDDFKLDLLSSVSAYEKRDASRIDIWNLRFK